MVYKHSEQTEKWKVEHFRDCITEHDLMLPVINPSTMKCSPEQNIAKLGYFLIDLKMTCKVI